MDRRSGTGQMVYPVHLQQDRQGNIRRISSKYDIQQVLDIFSAREKIVQTEHLVSFDKQAFTQMRSQKSCAASNEYSHFSPSIDGRNTLCMHNHGYPILHRASSIRFIQLLPMP
jgi:hypothetical protein